MQYFDNLPKIIIKDDYGNSSIKTNLIARASIIPEIFYNPMLYYNYDIQDGDTPEIIAHKYYNDSYRYWIVLFANEMLDPQWDWPLAYKQFSDYLKEKYGDEDISGTIHHYEKIITQYDILTDTRTENVVNITRDDYEELITGTATYSLPTGDVMVTIDKRAVSIYTHEQEMNEKKRSIKILNIAYVDQLETEFIKLMSV